MKSTYDLSDKVNNQKEDENHLYDTHNVMSNL